MAKAACGYLVFSSRYLGYILLIHDANIKFRLFFMRENHRIVQVLKIKNIGLK